MADTKAKEATISVKVIVDKVNKRVVYAEADYTFVDILFSFMTLPLGTIVRLLEKHDDKKFEGLGSLKNLYQSLENFPECYLPTEECKYMLLNLRTLAYDHCRNLKLQIDNTEPLKYFQCDVCRKGYPIKSVFGTCTTTKCITYGKLVDKDVGFKKTDVCVSGGGVFVSDIGAFIVTDDLCVMPYTSANSIRLLTDHGITDQSCLEDIKLDMGCEEILHLLKMALSLDSVFTYLVFNRISSIRDLVVPSQRSDIDQTVLMKKDVSATHKMHLEVSLQKSTGKLLFAEARGDFIGLLFGNLSIPLGTVVGELMKGGVSSLTCINNIFKSISDMSVRRYLKSQDIKDILLKDLKIDRGLQKVKHFGMFIVTDDLIITPSSSYSTLCTLNNKNVSFDDIETYEISIGSIEGLKILNASLTSCSTLTDSLEHLLKK